MKLPFLTNPAAEATVAPISNTAEIKIDLVSLILNRLIFAAKLIILGLMNTTHLFTMNV